MRAVAAATVGALVTATLAPSSGIAQMAMPPDQPMSHPSGLGPRPPQSSEGMATMRLPLGIPMSREGSGTAWQPDSTRMHALHWMPDGWMLMLHGLAFIGYDWQGSDRGDRKFMSTNWVMFMARHELAGGSFGGRVMLSGEP